jgi:hypothetical protein
VHARTALLASALVLACAGAPRADPGTGSRWITRQIPVPTRSFVVAAAAMESATKGSTTS